VATRSVRIDCRDVIAEMTKRSAPRYCAESPRGSRTATRDEAQILNRIVAVVFAPEVPASADASEALEMAFLR
jgi:hypothetical protein